MFLKMFGCLYILTVILTVIGIILVEKENIKEMFMEDKVKFCKTTTKLLLFMFFSPIIMTKYFFDNEY